MLVEAATAATTLSLLEPASLAVGPRRRTQRLATRWVRLSINM